MPSYGDIMGISGVVDDSGGTFTITDIEFWQMPFAIGVANRPGFAAEWDGGTAYAVGDIVVGDGSPDSLRYRCIAANTNQQPPNATYWVRDDTTYPQLRTLGATPTAGVARGVLKHSNAVGFDSLVASGASGTMTKPTGYGKKLVAPVRVTGVQASQPKEGADMQVVFVCTLSGPWREEAV